ncbi:MAG: hypothetical protein HYY23_06085 [Verrucomicrobia bacterium]|nr:hypothetical protein [Verrucomicrobiota bacterium]
MKNSLITAFGICLSSGVLSAQEKVDFVKDIQPIFEKTCVKCHGPEKQKGKLRLDSKDSTFKRASDSQVIVPGNAEKSDLYRRVTLPQSDDDRMPNEGDPLPKAQVDLIRDWINQGAIWPDAATFKTAASEKKETGLAEHKPSAEELKAVAQLETLGVSARPIAMNVGWREANFHLLGSNVTDSTLVPLKSILGLVDLNLGGTKITDTGLANLKGLTNLTRLHLERTEITDSGLAQLKDLKNLTYLNLYGTPITDSGLDHLKGLANLKNLYLWQTKVSDNGVGNLKKSLPKLEISRGFELKPPEKEPAKEPAKEEAKK